MGAHSMFRDGAHYRREGQPAATSQDQAKKALRTNVLLGPNSAMLTPPDFLGPLPVLSRAVRLGLIEMQPAHEDCLGPVPRGLRVSRGCGARGGFIFQGARAAHLAESVNNRPTSICAFGVPSVLTGFLNEVIRNTPASPGRAGEGIHRRRRQLQEIIAASAQGSARNFIGNFDPIAVGLN